VIDDDLGVVGVWNPGLRPWAAIVVAGTVFRVFHPDPPSSTSTPRMFRWNVTRGSLRLVKNLAGTNLDTLLLNRLTCIP
jgi:hypothetical protein